MNGLVTAVEMTQYVPLLARTRTIHWSVDPVRYDCVTVIVVRDGSATVFSEFGRQPVKVGDVILLGANVLCGAQPEKHITVSTVYLDTDYVIDQVRWQYSGFIRDRLDAQSFADNIYTEPAQVLSLGEARAGTLMPWLDELVELSIDGGFARHFFRMQALWFSIAHVVCPLIKVSPVRLSETQRTHTRATLPRDRRFAPLRVEVRTAAELLRNKPEQRWTLGELAAQAHLSSSRLSSVFVDAYGKTPLAYLTMIRAELLAKYLRETDLSVTAAMHRVGWHSRGHGTELFRQYVGLTPGSYRQMRRSAE